MNGGVAIFILLIIAMVMVTAIVTTWLQSRAPARTGEPAAKREVELLADENAGLRNQVLRLEERLAVLERIATDPAGRTAREIEQLRHG